MSPCHIRTRIHFTTKPTRRTCTQMPRDDVPCETPFVHRIRASSPETRTLKTLVSDHTVLSAQMVAHPNSVSKDFHVARAIFVCPFAEEGICVLIVIGVLRGYLFERRRAVDQERRLYACGFTCIRRADLQGRGMYSRRRLKRCRDRVIPSLIREAQGRDFRCGTWYTGVTDVQAVRKRIPP